VIETNLRAAIDRWPQFTPYAVGAGYRSVYAIALRLRGNIIGALNLFRAEPGPLATQDNELAQAIADLASIIILQSQARAEARDRDEQLQHAPDSRVIIEQAKHMLGERANIDLASAFERIHAMSRNTNTKLTDLATNIVNGRVGTDACEMARISHAKFGMSSNAEGPKNGLPMPTTCDASDTDTSTDTAALISATTKSKRSASGRL
jgi:hypothetical protein